jgi:small subunit ribosomal protein S3
MGQKVNPTGIRLGITENWRSNWYADKDYADMLEADLAVRNYLYKQHEPAQISRIQIERPARSARITIHAARPGIMIGKKGEGVEKLRQKLQELLNVPTHVNIEEIRKPEIDAKLVADSVAQQLTRRIMFRRAMKRAITSALSSGAKGIKISVSGRLGGAEIARTEWLREGRVPLHTLRANIDYATSEALTTYGIIGVKVWIFKGEQFAAVEAKAQTANVEQKG